MGFFSKDIKTMDDLFVHTLRDIYYAEKQILKALPEMIEKATDPALKQAFQTHLGETKNHVTRVEQVFKMHGVDAKGIDCPAIDGILDEANEVAGDIADKQVLDAGLVAAAQAVEHYEITRYGTLIAWAKQLGAQRLRERPAEEPGRGEGGGQEADGSRGVEAQSEGRELTICIEQEKSRQRRLSFCPHSVVTGAKSAITATPLRHCNTGALRDALSRLACS